MRAVVTRVKSARVEILGKKVGEIGVGFLVLLGIGKNDSSLEVKKLADKILHLRVFADENGKMNLDLKTVEGKILIVSQFTLYADLKSRRPGFTESAKVDIALPLYEEFLAYVEKSGFLAQHGKFGADMEVFSINDGPVTILLDTDKF